MYAVIMSASALTFVLSAVAAVSLLGLHYELDHQRSQRLEAALRTQAAIIDEQEATIGAYRESMAIAMAELTTQPQVSPERDNSGLRR